MADESKSRRESGGKEIEGLPVAPSMELSLEEARVPHRHAMVDERVLLISGVAVVIAFMAGLVAQFLTHLIGFVTNVSFYGRFSTQVASPAGNHLGLWVIPVPVIGGIVVGYMARYGSKAIRGHGIPEAMEAVLQKSSRISPKVAILKPLSAAVSIGSGQPFGAEGPVIQTGAAIGSILGQALRSTTAERKVLLACGAAAGLAATRER